MIEEKRKIIEKITKLLDLANSSSFDGEITAARRAAAKLLIQYNLTEEEMRINGNLDTNILIEDVGTKHKKVDVTDTFLFQYICNFNGVYLLRITSKRPKYGLRNESTEGRWRLIGTNSNIEISKYMFELIRHQIYELTVEYFKNIRGSKGAVKLKNSYRLGLVDGVNSNLIKLKKDSMTYANEVGLVVVDNAIINLNNAINFYKKEHTVVNVNIKSNTYDSYNIGYNDKDKISLRKGIKSESNENKKLITK